MIMIKKMNRIILIMIWNLDIMKLIIYNNLIEKIHSKKQENINILIILLYQNKINYMIQNFNFSMKINKNNKLIMCKNKIKNPNNNN